MDHPTSFELPPFLTLAQGNGGLPKLLINTACSTAEIYLHGATVTHFAKKGEPPLLFLSGKSDFTSEQPIRGGVPIIYPWFGARVGHPNHGTARISTWEIIDAKQPTSECMQLRLRLPTTSPCEIQLLVTVGKTLTMELAVSNHSSNDVQFETCFHTYFQVSSIHEVTVHGLQHASYYDQLSGENLIEANPAIRVEQEVDRIYHDTSATVTIEDRGHRRRIIIEKSGSASTVLWNPWIEKSRRMPDFGDEEYLQMLCVESGNVRSHAVNLSPDGSAHLKVVIGSEELV